MLKHLPEGMLPFNNNGFARDPYLPLENENVTVYCRIDAEDGTPALLMRVNNGEETFVAAERLADRYFRFSLGAFAFGTRVSYRLATDHEESRVFTFEPQREHTYCCPTALLREANAVHAQFDGFAVTFTADAKITAHTNPVSGEACEAAELSLSNDFSFVLSTKAPFCQLKRFSEVVASIESYTVRMTEDGAIRTISQKGDLNAAHVWGTGERFDSADQRNGATNGRVVEKFTQQGDQTYLPIPFFMTENGLGWYRESDISAKMDFRGGLTIAQATEGSVLTRDHLLFGRPAEVLSQFVAMTGKPVLPPDWAFGVWMSANGWNNDAEVDAQLEAMKKHDYPADVMVLEAWSDEQTFYRWNDTNHWKDPAAMVRRVRESGLHLVLWQIPIVKYEWDGEPNEFLAADIKEAIEKGYCVLNADGTPYRITENWFHNSMLLDYTNPEAVKWWFGKRKYLLDMGVEGFKTDGGEFLFANDAKLHDGSTGLRAHNLYPTQYIGCYHDFMRQNGVNGVTFSRADYVGAQTRPMHWSGDQLSLWSELRSQLAAGLSSGLSGLLFWGFDIGGFAGELPTPELYLRATAMACFSPVMQWHAEPRNGQFYATHEDGFNNDRSPWNLAQKLNAPEILTVSTYFAKLRQKLRPYLTQEAAYCVEHGRPLMAHLCLDFPADKRAQSCNDQYMLGRSLLVAPITDENVNIRNVYLPEGTWKDYFTGESFKGGCTIAVHCPIDRIPVFERTNINE